MPLSLSPMPWKTSIYRGSYGKIWYEIFADAEAGPDREYIGETKCEGTATLICLAPRMLNILHELLNAGAHLYEDPNNPQDEKVVQLWNDARSIVSLFKD